MLYILFRNFHKILQRFPMHLDLHIDINIQTNKVFLKEQLIFITTQHSFIKFGNIRKNMAYRLNEF